MFFDVVHTHLGTVEREIRPLQIGLVRREESHPATEKRPSPLRSPGPSSRDSAMACGRSVLLEYLTASVCVSRHGSRPYHQIGGRVTGGWKTSRVANDSTCPLDQAGDARHSALSQGHAYLARQ